MKSTGIVRRIDELGRVVIPKEIRRTMRIKSGEELEIFTTDEELVLKKFSAVRLFADVAEAYVEALSSVSMATVAVCDNEETVVCRGELRRALDEAKPTEALAATLEKRQLTVVSDADIGAYLSPCAERAVGLLAAPIIVGGDVVGSIVMIRTRGEIGEADRKQAETAATFLAGQF